MNTVSFPGLGIGPLDLNPSFIKTFFPDSDFFLDIKWYAVIITFGMILAFFYARSRAKVEGITDDDIYDVTLWCILFGIVGARLFYVLFSDTKYLVTDGDLWHNIKETFLGVINIREGGLAIYGGIIFGVLTGYFIARKKRIRFAVLADVAAPAIMIGQIIGRWGNFFNVEAYGDVTALPWRMSSATIARSLYGDGKITLEAATQIKDGVLGVHPTFLYESVWNLIGFILIALFYKKKKYNGQVFLFYAMWYGLGRFFIEGLRMDSLMMGPIRVSQLIAAVCFLAGAVMFFLFVKKTPVGMKLVPLAADGADAPAAESEEPSSDKTEITESETDNGETD